MRDTHPGQTAFGVSAGPCFHDPNELRITKRQLERAIGETGHGKVLADHIWTRLTWMHTK